MQQIYLISLPVKEIRQWQSDSITPDRFILILYSVVKR